MSRAHCTKLVPRARLFRPPARQLVPREEALPARPPLAAPRERQGPGHRDLHGRIPRRLPGVLRPLHFAPQRGAWPLRRALCRVGGRRGAREPVDRRQPHRHLPVGLVSRGASRLKIASSLAIVCSKTRSHNTLGTRGWRALAPALTVTRKTQIRNAHGGDTRLLSVELLAALVAVRAR